MQFKNLGLFSSTNVKKKTGVTDCHSTVCRERETGGQKGKGGSPEAGIMYAAVKPAQQDYRHLFVFMVQKREKIYANDPQQCN